MDLIARNLDLRYRHGRRGLKSAPSGGLAVIDGTLQLAVRPLGRASGQRTNLAQQVAKRDCLDVPIHREAVLPGMHDA